MRYTNNIMTRRSLGMSVVICVKSGDSYRRIVLITACRRKTFAQATSEDSLPTNTCIYVYKYTSSFHEYFALFVNIRQLHRTVVMVNINFTLEQAQRPRRGWGWVVEV